MYIIPISPSYIYDDIIIGDIISSNEEFELQFESSAKIKICGVSNDMKFDEFRALVKK